MAEEHVSFSESSVADAIETAKTYYHGDQLAARAEKGILADDGHLSIAAQCISVTVNDGKICLKLPLKIGNVCLPIPKSIPNGTVAEACLHICTTWGFPTGVKVTISVAGKIVLSKSFGKC